MKHIKIPMPSAAPVDVRAAVSEIIESVASGGDSALRELCERFDGSSSDDMRVSREEIDDAYAMLHPRDISDMKFALERIRRFADAQRGTMSELSIEMDGVSLRQTLLPVGSCMCYVPGGRYPLFSTALMLIAPAKAAGVPRIAACSPARRSTGRIDPRTLAAMDLAGADEIWTVGGAQAVAAFAYGTESIAPVDMIVGPGSAYVAEAKRQCFGRVGIDFVAGPSEVLIVADASARADAIAADLLAQCEHDVNARGILITTDASLAERVLRELEIMLDSLPTAETAREAWRANGEILLAEDMEEAIREADLRAPEHLEVQTEEAADDPDAAARRFSAYGSLFIGGSAAEVFGDYASGPNHTLPTSRGARYTGGLWVGSFMRTATYQHMTREAAAAFAPTVARMARGEGLEAHARAAEVRARS